MKIRILQTIQAILFIAIGAVGGHYEGLSKGTMWGYSQIVGDLQNKVELAAEGKRK